jgi:hypothetical protein
VLLSRALIAAVPGGRGPVRRSPIGARLRGSERQSWAIPTGSGAACTVEVILASPEDVATDQGEPDVVLNPAGTAGAKIDGADEYQAACLQQAVTVLKGVK